MHKGRTGHLPAEQDRHRRQFGGGRNLDQPGPLQLGAVIDGGPDWAAARRSISVQPQVSSTTKAEMETNPMMKTTKRHRSFRGQSFPRLDLYEVSIAIHMKGTRAKHARSRLHGELTHSGFNATRGFTNGWARSRQLRKVPVRMRPSQVKCLMVAFHADCLAGRMAIVVEGVRVGES
jgi:hypothetical protein